MENNEQIKELKKYDISSNLKKIINLLVFPFEFILSLLLAVFLYKYICIKKYEEITNTIYLIGTILTTILVIGIIIWNYLKNKDKIEKIFMSFIIPIGMMFLIFMMPTYVPDEYAHIWKSYEISEGTLITPINEEGISHTEIPEFFKTNIIRIMNKYNEMNDAIKQETDYNDKVEVETTAQGYCPILYMFSSIGLFISRIIGINGILAQYIARIFNFIVFLILSYYSIKIIPFGKLLLSCILFIPMMLQQAVSVSADCIVNSVCIFFIAFNMYLLFKNKEITKFEMISYIILSLIIGVAKIVYIPLVALSFLLIGTSRITKKNKILMISISIIATTIVACSWYIFSARYTGNAAYLEANNVNSVEQIKLLLKYPIHIFTVIGKTIYKQGESYLYMMMGSYLGWLEINIPLITIIGFIILVMLSIYFENNKVALNWKQKIWTILIFIVGVILVLMALYVGWSSVGADEVAGIQGRYFIPIILLPLLCLSKKENYVKIKNINLTMMTMLSLLDCYVVYKIIMFFI